MPKGCGVAIVVVTHQHPDHNSLLPELLAKHCVLPVEAARDWVDLESNHVYVCPPGKDVTVVEGRLRLVEQNRDGALHLPIDRFFRSLAADQQDHAICVVLSGTGTDGTLGLRAIKGNGGMAMVQDLSSANYPGMPRSAAGTLLADFVLPPSLMAARLLSFAHTQRETRATPSDDDPLSEALGKVFGLVRERTGHDFRGYKIAAMRRRVERRMRVHDLNEPGEYVSFLAANPHEIELLFSELLINVTSFFRDHEVFDELESTLAERLITRGNESGLRVWVPGCSTGEEPYSIAMLLSEIAVRAGRHLDAQIFATDLDQNAIDQARVGFYPRGVAVDLTPQRLARFFTAEDRGYRIKKEIRELLVFATQNVIRDPPFTKLDLVSCRNLLIYLGADLQQRLIPMFHYALKPGGVLLLGTSETIGGFEQLFKPLDRKHRIYERQEAVLRLPSVDWLARREVPLAPAVVPARPTGTGNGVFGILEKALLDRFVPPSVIVDQSGDIVFVQGRTGQYLEPSPGEPRNNVFAMARDGLEPGLSIALRAASAEDNEIVQHVRVRSNADDATVSLVVRRLEEPESVRGLFRISFQPSDEGTSRAQPRSARPRPAREMEEQLDQTRRALTSANEELQSTNEELKSMNEELQSTNEELQSSNEELETSREELQVLNDELQGVNASLQCKIDDLAQANDDMNNLLDSTQIATLFLDRNLKILRFTDQTREVIHLLPSDVGRPIGDLVSHLRYAALSDDAQSVLETLQPHEVEVQTMRGHWRLMRMLPYRTARNVIDGVVITLVDIERVKQTELLAASRGLAESIVHSVREPLVVVDRNFVVVSANPAFVRTFRAVEAPIEQRSLFDIGSGMFASPPIRSLLEGLLAEDRAVQDCEIVHALSSRGQRRMLLNACRLTGRAEVADHLLLTLADITGRTTVAP
jgi:two-component system CheB/CheR fusion protein